MSEPWRKTEEAIFRDLARKDRSSKKKHKWKRNKPSKPKTKFMHF